MKPLEETYGYRYFRGRGKNLSWRAPIVCKALVEVFKPGSVLDVGCAVGDLVKGFLDLGVHAMGLEGSSAALPYMMIPLEALIQHDLRYRLETGWRFDLVICFEVAEHIESEYSWQLVENLTTVSKRWVVLSAAPPDQGGIGHVNCQKQWYWMNLMAKAGFDSRDSHTFMLKALWSKWKDKKGIKAYYQNVMVFERGRL